ncbi:hypothetical protein [Flammeovirga agarivorans]|uniref:Uncharacterized protein n=1 Tax=Flammeovirga agarivorans TaxID=2726742 RepID=A0A7X8SJC0_9BACT|nr:hypothetical protein [Flammeovirga agarivorans]NLR91197.1 hypothetical protein [Flammeovirga agarivorans]
MWKSIRSILTNHKLEDKKVLEELVYQLKQQKFKKDKQLKEIKYNHKLILDKVPVIQKQITKETFELKSRLSNNDRSSALLIQDNIARLNKEKESYDQLSDQLQHEITDVERQVLILKLQIEKIDFQVLLLRNKTDDSFDLDDFMGAVQDIELMDYNHDLTSLEIDLALENSPQEEKNESKISDFFEKGTANKEHMTPMEGEVELKKKLQNFFNTESEKEDIKHIKLNKRIADFFHQEGESKSNDIENKIDSFFKNKSSDQQSKIDSFFKK